MSIIIKGYSVPAEQVVFVGNCASLVILNNKFYVQSYSLIFDFIAISVICGERYIRMKYNNCEMLMKLSKVHANKTQEFINKWT